MSIMIENLDMPIGCQKCKFFRKHMFGNGLDYSYSCILGAKDFPMPWIRQMDERASDCPIKLSTAIDNIKHEIFNAIDNVPMTLSRNDADNLLKMDIQDIIDKHLKKGESEVNNG